jgi:hypothetical protein
MGVLVSGMKAATMMASMTSSAPNTNGGPGISAVTTCHWKKLSIFSAGLWIRIDSIRI